jgi:hypothetical protein
MAGIIEVEHDKFYVAGGNFDLSTFVTKEDLISYGK